MIGEWSQLEILYTDVLQMLHPQKDHVRLILPDEKLMTEVLIIPDFSGYNTMTKAFTPHYGVPPKMGSADSHAEYFRVMMAGFYHNKPHTYILAFGHGAILYADECLNLKVNMVNGELEPMHTLGVKGVDLDTSTSSWSYETDKSRGFARYNHANLQSGLSAAELYHLKPKGGQPTTVDAE